MRYTLYSNYGIVAEGNNKAKLIKKCRQLNIAGTVVDDKVGGIIFENEIQRQINNMSKDGLDR